MTILSFLNHMLNHDGKCRRFSDRGETNLLGLIYGMGLAMTILAFSAPWLLQTQTRQSADQATAQQIQTVSNALSGYVSAYYSTIEGVATATTPAVIPVSALVSTNFLPTGYSSTTPYGSTVVGQVLQPSPGILVGAVVTQGGTAPAGAHLNQLANLIGAQGGFVPTANLSSLPGICGTNCFQGTGGIWKATFTQYPFTGVGPGSLIALQTFNDNNLQQDFLYRSSVPGNPNANTMQTSINMNGNNVNNAGSVNTYNLTSPNGTITASGQNLNGLNLVNTYNLTSPNGWISTQNLSTGQINTNGQPIYAGNGWGHDAWGAWMPPCPTYASEYAYWKGECGCYEWVLACFTGLYANGMGVMDRIVSQGVAVGNVGSGATSAGMPWINGFGQQFTP